MLTTDQMSKMVGEVAEKRANVREYREALREAITEERILHHRIIKHLADSGEYDLLSINTSRMREVLRRRDKWASLEVSAKHAEFERMGERLSGDGIDKAG